MPGPTPWVSGRLFSTVLKVQLTAQIGLQQSKPLEVFLVRGHPSLTAQRPGQAL